MFFRTAVACLLILLPLAVIAQPDPQEELEREIEEMVRAQSEPANPKQLEATARKILRDMSAVRELEVKRPVAMEVATREQIVAYVDSRIKEEMKDEDLAGQELALKRLGLIPNDLDMRKFLLELYGEQVAGYYDPFKQKFYISSWMDPMQQTPIMAHELTHALQDQHFNLKPFLTPIPENSDATSARQAVVEGDAVVSMFQYLTGQTPKGAGRLLRSSMTSSAFPVFQNAPRYFQEALFFPYADGADFIAELKSSSGFKSVNAIYKDLPRSSEQILHPEKYAGELRDDPTPIALEMSLPGWSQVHTDVLGELVMRVMLSAWLDEDRAVTAAEGWDGDRYRAYVRKKDADALLTPGKGPARIGARGTMIALRSVWDSAEDAREFFEAYVSIVPEKYDGATRRKAGAKPKSKAKGPEKAGTQLVTFDAGEDGLVAIELRGTEVVVVDGAPDDETAESVRKAAWGK